MASLPADLVRVDWLTARLAARTGRIEEAIATQEEVRKSFADQGLPYDAALASLDLAVLYLEEGRTAEVQELAREMAEIFKAQGIAREALAAPTSPYPPLSPFINRSSAAFSIACTSSSLKVLAGAAGGGGSGGGTFPCNSARSRAPVAVVTGRTG